MQDPWKITGEERAKHDAQFFQLKPVGGFVTGNQAKGFFLQSGLPAQVLMQIWSLADMNSDGKMDKKEFSIACHLISNKLKGVDIPKSVPASLKADPTPMLGSFGAAPMPTPAPISMGTMTTIGPVMSSMPQMGNMPLSPGLPTPGFPSGFSGGRMTNGITPVGSAWGMPAAPSGGVGPTSTSANFPSPSKTTAPISMAPVGPGEWAIPHTQKLKYNQLFNMHDRSRKGYLSGVEAKSILQQTGLMHNVLAQIWNLSDIDNDGKLTNEQFCLAMHLVDVSRSGQVLPSKLPPNLVPPSYRRGSATIAPVGLPPASLNQPGMMGPTSPIPALPSVNAPTQQRETFGDLLGGFGIPNSPQKTTAPVELDAQKESDIFKQPETFEDKRKENFDKGQAELEKRRAMLQEQLKQQEEERLAHERAEQEKRERIRQEQERKRQLELEKQLEKQRAAEHEREEHRRKAMEQREAARRELERQRQMEWERQRRDQLMSEKQREKAQVDRLKRETGERKMELETMDNRKSEIRNRVEQARTTVTDFTGSIEGMRGSRDQKVADIQRFERQIQELQQKLNMLNQQKSQFDVQVQSQNNTVDDTYKAVMHSYNNKKVAIEKHKLTVKQLEESTASKLEDIDVTNNEAKQIASKLQSLEQVNKQLRGTMTQKKTEYEEAKKQRATAANVNTSTVPTQKDANSFGWLDNAFGSQNSSSASPSQDIWASAFSNTSGSSARQSPFPSSNAQTTDSVAWASAGNALSSAFSSQKAETPTTVKSTPSAPSPALAPVSTATTQDEDPWAKFDKEKTFGSDPFSSQSGKDTWAAAFFNNKKGDTPVSISGPPLSSEGLSSASTNEKSQYKKHKALFQFVARHQDELAITEGDVIWVKFDEPGAEPGWVLGFLDDGTKGWFPKDYAKEVADDGTTPPFLQSDPTVFTFPETAATAATVAAAATFPEPTEKTAPAENIYGNLPAGGLAMTEQAPADEQPKSEVLPPGDDDNIYENINDIHLQQQQQQQLEQTSNSLVRNGPSPFMPVSGSTPSPVPGQGQAAPDGLKVQATLMWRAKRDNHLSFDKGDIITVQNQQDNWWSGELAGKVGWFPKSFVKVVGDSVAAKQDSASPVGNGNDIPSLEIVEPSPPDLDEQALDDSAESYVALYNYSSAEPSDLNFVQGDVIAVTKTVGEWWTGSIGGRSGVFPGNYVKKSDVSGNGANKRHSIAMITPLSAIPENSTVRSNSRHSMGRSHSTQSLNRYATNGQKPKNREIATVLALYQATGPEQLSLQPGQLIMIRKKSNSGWWEGELQARGQKRKIGWFPANYVKLMASGSRTTPSDSQKSLSPTPQPMDGGTCSRSATPISYPQPTSAPSLEQVIASFSYTAQNADELTFEKGSVINVLNKDDQAWWKGEMNGVEGMFPSNYVSALADSVTHGNGTASPTPNSSGHADENKRQSAIHELIQTEDSYLADLKLVYELFFKPITAEKALSSAELQTIFVNWREVMMCNKKLLMALKVRKKTSRGQNISYIGDILCENLPHMTPYIRFCSCQLNATTTLHEVLERDAKFKEQHMKCASDPRLMGMPLSTYLMKPMQRITRYPMLIEKILRYTSPEHVDHTTLSEAHSKATELCSQVNEGVREKENSDKLEWIQTHVMCDGLPEKITFNSVTNSLGPRKYLYSGSLYKHKSGKELTGFLFNDFLLLGQPQRPLGQLADVFSFDVKANVQFKMYRNPIFLNETMVKKSQNQEADSCVFTLQHTEKDYHLKAISTAERDIWMKKIDEAAKLFRETDRKRKEKAHSAYHKLRSYGVGRLLVVMVEGSGLIAGNDQVRGLSARGVGRLLVIVLEGSHLIPSDLNGKSDPYCEVNMGVQEHKTKVINNTLNPKWNHSMQFTIKDLREDVLCITVYDRDLFSPNDFLGRTEIRIKDIYDETKQDKKGPLTKRLKLYEVDTGEVVVKLDLQIFEQTL